MDMLSPGQLAARPTVYSLHQTINIPPSGILYLRRGVPTSAVPIPIGALCTLRRVSARVDVLDSSRTYNLEILNGATVVDTVALSSVSLQTTSTAVSGQFVAGDTLAARLVLAAGTGSSSFRQIDVQLTLGE